MPTRVFLLFVFISMIGISGAHAQWAKSIGGSGEDATNSICPTPDGGYAIAGFTSSFGAGSDDFWVLKMDASGNIQWQKTYGSFGFEIATQIQPTSDGGFIVVGFGDLSSMGNNDAWLLKLDGSGNVEWQKAYGTTANETATTVIQTSDGGFLFTGSIEIASNSYNAWLVKLSSGGNIQWQKSYGGAGSENGSSVLELPNGQYVMAGGTTSFGGGALDAWVVFVDSTGTELSSKAYGWFGDDTFFSLKPTPDGALLALGLSTSWTTEFRDLWVVKMTTDGNIIWQAAYAGPDYDQPSTVQVESDNEYIITGSTISFGAGGTDLWILKIASNGSIVWQKTYGGTGEDAGASSAPGPNGGIMVVGNTQSFQPGPLDGWLLSLDADGNIDPSCLLATDTLISAIFVNRPPVDTTGFGFATSVSITNTSVTPVATTATTALQCGVVCVFCDDFENDILDPTWNYVKPSWSESGGDLIATATKKALAVASPAFAGCTGCAFETSMISDGAQGNKMSMLAWYTDKGNNVEVMMKQPSGKFILKQKAGGTVVAKTKALMSLQPNVSYDVRVEYDGTALHLIVNGTDIASVNAPPPAAGTIALQAAKTTARFGHVLVE